MRAPSVKRWGVAKKWVGGASERGTGILKWEMCGRGKCEHTNLHKSSTRLSQKLLFKQTSLQNFRCMFLDGSRNLRYCKHRCSESKKE